MKAPYKVIIAGDGKIDLTKMTTCQLWRACWLLDKAMNTAEQDPEYIREREEWKKNLREGGEQCRPIET